MTIVFALVIFIVGLIFGNSLPAYLKQKGENLATKEDIKDITNKVEEVRSVYTDRLEDLRHQNELILEQGKQRHQLRLAALDKRLEINQQAFTLWVELKNSVFKDTIGDVVVKCQDWWEHNCLYLDENVRNEFRNAYFAALHHKELVGFLREKLVDHDTGLADIKTNWNTINQLGNIIFESVELPSIADNKRVSATGVEAQTETGIVKIETGPIPD